MRFLSPTLIASIGLLLAAAGMVVGVDSIVFYVFGIVDGIPWDPLSILAPIYNPAPMFVHAYRPLATFVVKLGGAVFGRDLEALRLFGFAHALVLIPFGLAARHCLVAFGLTDRVATLAALSSMLLPTVLFSAWTIPEFDVIGAIWVLMAMAELQLGRKRRAIPYLLLSLLTKETTAVLMFASLLASGMIDARRDPASWRRHLLAPAVYFGLLLLVVSPLLFGGGDQAGDGSHDFNVGAEGFGGARFVWMALHGGSQLFYVLGAAGASLLVLAAGGQRLPIWAVLLVGGLPWLAPIVRIYNHYESVTISSWLMVVCTMAPAFGALVWIAVRGERNHAVLAAAIVLAVLGLLGGPILANGARADVSARLFAPVLPLLHGLAWFGAARMLANVDATRAARSTRVVAVALALAFGWTPIAGAVNAWQFTEARFAVEATAKQGLIRALRDADSGPAGCPVVLYTNRDQELAQEELALWGQLPPRITDCVLLVQLATTQVGDTPLGRQIRPLDGYDQRRESFPGAALFAALPAGNAPFPVILYVQGARSTLPAGARSALDLDFRWAEDRMPDVLPGSLEQAVRMIYAPSTPLEEFFDGVADRRQRHSADFFQVPVWLNELPARLAADVPFVETYRYAAASYEAGPRVPR